MFSHSKGVVFPLAGGVGAGVRVGGSSAGSGPGDCPVGLGQSCVSPEPSLWHVQMAPGHPRDVNIPVFVSNVLGRLT